MSTSRNDAEDVARTIHHQIGNSLQSVVSLLNLETRAAPPEAARVLAEAGRRVRVIMRLHQRLQEGAGYEVRLDELLIDVCRDVAELDTADRVAEVHMDVEPLVTSSRTGSALAMITAELVGNALEHGLADRSGVIQVGLRAAGDRTILTVTDNGVGSKFGEWKRGFGLSLVLRMAAQLGATVIERISPDGCRYEVACHGVWTDPPS